MMMVAMVLGMTVAYWIEQSVCQNSKKSILRDKALKLNQFTFSPVGPGRTGVQKTGRKFKFRNRVSQIFEPMCSVF
jgi:hypothetical protein